MPLADNLWLNSWQYIAGFTFTSEELRHRANPLGILFELGACLVGALSNAGNRLTRTDDLGRDFYRLIGQHKITRYYVTGSREFGSGKVSQSAAAEPCSNTVLTMDGNGGKVLEMFSTMIPTCNRDFGK